MGVRSGPVRVRYAVLAALALALACGGETPPPVNEVPEEPIVGGSPHMVVVAGTDTLEVWSPAVLAYFPGAGGQGEPSLAVMEAGRTLQEALQVAQPRLADLGVRVLTLGDLPVPQGVAPEVEAAAGPALNSGNFGFLLVHPRGRIQRLDGNTTGPDLVCAAVRLFELEAGAGSCG